MSDRILLDTHVWLWMSLEPTRVSEAATERLAVASKQGALIVAAISLFEVANLVSRNRINLSMPTQSWFDISFQQPGLQLLPLTPQIAAETSFLPTDFTAIQATGFLPRRQESMT